MKVFQRLDDKYSDVRSLPSILFLRAIHFRACYLFKAAVQKAVFYEIAVQKAVL